MNYRARYRPERFAGLSRNVRQVLKLTRLVVNYVEMDNEISRLVSLVLPSFLDMSGPKSSPKKLVTLSLKH